MEKEKNRIESFKQFLKAPQKQVKEEKICLQVEWWNDCLVEVEDDLKQECGGILSYEILTNYVKNKIQILGRPDPGYDEARLLQHIKDLIFQHHGDSLVFDGMCNWGEDNSEVQAKGLVVGELAKVILDKVLDTIPDPDDPIPGVTTVSLTDKEPRVLIPMQPVEQVSDDEVEYFDDLPFESKRPVKGFKDYIKSSNRK